MMIRFRALTAILCAAAVLAGCAGGTPQPGQQAGLAPLTQPPAVPPGAIVAGVVGATIGLSLRPEDLRRALEAEYRALEFGVAGAPTLWNGVTQSVYGEVVPGPRYSVNEYECRDYTHTIYNGPNREAGRGTSCRVAGGPWGPVA
jgi:surface antigen